VLKRLNRSRCRSGADSCGSKEPGIGWEIEIERMHSQPRGGYKSAMRPFVTLLWTLVYWRFTVFARYISMQLYYGIVRVCHMSQIGV